jgi:hypothetical protein
MAIEFAKEQNDAALWQEFLKYAMDKPPFIVGLLETTGAFISPADIIKRIPLNLMIPGLKRALQVTFRECSAQVLRVIRCRCVKTMN